MRAVLAALAVLLLAACEDVFGPSRSAIEAAVKELDKPLSPGWVLYPSDFTCMPAELRHAAIVGAGACLPLPGAREPTFFCDVEFQLADRSKKVVEITMRKDSTSRRWSANIQTPIASHAFFTPC